MVNWSSTFLTEKETVSAAPLAEAVSLSVRNVFYAVQSVLYYITLKYLSCAIFPVAPRWQSLHQCVFCCCCAFSLH